MPRQLRMKYPGVILSFDEPGRPAEDGETCKGIRRGWGPGSETFREELLAQANTRAGDDRVAKLKMKPDEQNEFKLEC